MKKRKTQGGPERTASPAGPVARWARRFRRLACVCLVPQGEPPWHVLRAIAEARRGGIGIPRAALSGISQEARDRFSEKPFVITDLPGAALARVSSVSGPRAPARIVQAAAHALVHGAPLVLLDRKDALAISPLVAHTLAVPGGSASRAIAANLESVLRSAASGVQDSYGQIENAGSAIRDLASERARERTLQGLLMRLSRARKLWASRDAARRFRKVVLAAEEDSQARGVPKGETDVLALTLPVGLGYVDLLPLFMTRLGPGSDLARAFLDPLALLVLGLAPAVLLDTD